MSMNARGESIREKIINIADDLFYKCGYNNTSFADISQAVGISRGNFYHHFKTKDDILAAVIENRKIIIKTMLDSWSRQSQNPKERLYSYIEMMVGLKEEIHKHGCPVGSVCAEIVKLRNINQTNATEMISLFLDWMKQQFTLLAYGEKQSTHMAMHLVSRTQGISLMANAFSDTDFLIREMDQLKSWIAEL